MLKSGSATKKKYIYTIHRIHEYKMLQPAQYKNILQSYQENLCAKRPWEGGGTQPSKISTQKEENGENIRLRGGYNL